MANGISSLQPKSWTFVFCQFTSSPRDAASLAIVSNMGTRSSSSSTRRETSSAKSRSVKELWPNVQNVDLEKVNENQLDWTPIQSRGYGHSGWKQKLDEHYLTKTQKFVRSCVEKWIPSAYSLRRQNGRVKNSWEAEWYEDSLIDWMKGNDVEWKKRAHNREDWCHWRPGPAWKGRAHKRERSALDNHVSPRKVHMMNHRWAEEVRGNTLKRNTCKELEHALCNMSRLVLFSVHGGWKLLLFAGYLPSGRTSMTYKCYFPSAVDWNWSIQQAIFHPQLNNIHQKTPEITCELKQ